ncbi:unnamed protein product [Nippostrongylus brasiliensis]|uniref:Astacin domain-containing protein n=1 Tax=Nippostrongylus brasiliensis TaxID=27835 RepID=A0A0N4YC31_NIPBR|nr:unnamed protein product [Nippostrongylus brasiliensis]
MLCSDDRSHDNYHCANDHHHDYSHDHYYHDYYKYNYNNNNHYYVTRSTSQTDPAFDLYAAIVANGQFFLDFGPRSITFPGTCNTTIRQCTGKARKLAGEPMAGIR